MEIKATGRRFKNETRADGTLVLYNGKPREKRLDLDPLNLRHERVRFIYNIWIQDDIISPEGIARKMLAQAPRLCRMSIKPNQTEPSLAGVTADVEAIIEEWFLPKHNGHMKNKGVAQRQGRRSRRAKRNTRQKATKQKG